MAITNKLGNFALVGIKNLLIYKRDTGALVANIDKFVNITLTDTQATDYLRAGFGNPKILTVYGDRETKLEGTVGTLSTELLSVMYGTSGAEVKIKSMEDVKRLAVVSGKVTLPFAPNTNISVYKLDQFGKKLMKMEKVAGTTAPTEEGKFAVNAKDILFKTGSNFTVEVVYGTDMEVETIESKDIKPESYRMVGICVATDIESGKLFKGQIEIPNGSITPNTTLSAKNEASAPDPVSVSIDCLQDTLLGYPIALSFAEEI